MKALKWQRGRLAVEEVPKPRAGSEVLIRVLKSGICNTDIEIARGYAGFEGTLGHEFVGVVEESPDDTSLNGKRVVGEINAGCGQCDLCRAHDLRHCVNRTVLGIHGRNGAHAEYLTLPAVNLIEVPEGISDNAAVFVEPLAAAYGISEQVRLTPETRVAIIGDGKLGILCARSLAGLTNGLTLVGKHEEKLELGTKYGNITPMLLASIDSITEKFDIVVEASGSESGFATALDMVRPRGKIVLKSTFSGQPRWDAARVVVDEITVVGSRCGRFAPALELLSDGKVEIEDLVSDQFSLSDGVAAMARAAESGVLKVLLEA